MRALQFRGSPVTYLLARLAARWAPAVLAAGRVPGLRLVRTSPPALPGRDWLRVRPVLAGICGSDLALLTAQSSPALSPFVSFPAVLGHEVLARVVDAGPTNGLPPGTRVVVDPFLPCAVRGLEPCPPCQRGETSLCTATAEGRLAPGMLVGYCRDVPGGWSEEMVVHRSQVYAVPREVPDATAALVEPFSVALHAVLRCPPSPGERVLVLGAGTIGLCLVAALRFLVPGCHLTVVSRHATQAWLAPALGADLVVPESRGVGAAAVEVAGARAYRPVLGRPVHAGGFAHVYDSVGSAASLDACLRVGGPRARIVLVGCAGVVRRLDLTFVWARELHVLGSYGYAREPGPGGTRHTFELALDYVARRPDSPLAALVTHRLPLSAWRRAIRISLRRRRHRAVKVVFDCQAGASAGRG
jgi:threonine dehydrogenase-like Zn-dependent dehydrogenase